MEETIVGNYTICYQHRFVFVKTICDLECVYCRYDRGDWDDIIYCAYCDCHVTQSHFVEPRHTYWLYYHFYRYKFKNYSGRSPVAPPTLKKSAYVQLCDDHQLAWDYSFINAFCPECYIEKYFDNYNNFCDFCSVSMEKDPAAHVLSKEHRFRYFTLKIFNFNKRVRDD